MILANTGKAFKCVISKIHKKPDFQGFFLVLKTVLLLVTKKLYFRENETEKALSTELNLFKEGKK